MGGVFYDGDLVGVEMNSFLSSGDELSFDTQRMSYSQHAGLFRKSTNAPLQALYVNSLMVTEDERLVFGVTQATETDWLGKLSVPAGAVKEGPDGYPSLGAQLYREITEEVGISPDYHIRNEVIIPGWINGMSQREKNYHLTASFVTPLKLTEKEIKEWFKDWITALKKWSSFARERGLNIKSEFADLRFLPNDRNYLLKFIEEQDKMNTKANLLGKSLDVVEEWVRSYNCDIEALKASKTGARIYLPQPVMR